MITTHLRNLLTAVVCLFAGVTAQAQFSGTLDLPVSDSKFDSMPVEFSLSGVASALGTDAATLAGALEAWEAGTNDMFFLADPEDATVLYSDYTQGSKGGFWVLNTGVPAGWGTEGLTWYNTISWDAEADVFAINIGQYPEVSEVGDVYKPHFVMKYNDKEVGFDVTINFVENTEPVYEIPEPATLKEAELNIVGSAEVTVEQYPRTGYDSDAVTIELADLAEKLGVEPGLIAASMDKILYATAYNTGDVEDGGGLKKDSLTNEFTAGAPGFWLHAVQNDLGEETGECSAAPYGGEDKFFVEAFAFDAETATLSCNLGQYPGNLKGNEKWYTNFYLLYADKAYRVRYNLNTLEREQGSGTDGMNKVGETTVNVNLVVDESGGYGSTPIYPDIDAIAAALGCEADNISMQALDGTNNWATPTAGNQGFWFDAGGMVVAWGASSYFFIENPTSMDYSTLNVGQYPNRLNVDDEFETTLYFVNGENYYAYNVKLKMVPQEYNPDTQPFVSVETRSFTVQTIPSSTLYACDQEWNISNDVVESILGTATPTLYALSTDERKEKTGETYSNVYSCDPNPGFWMNSEGRASVWGDSDAKVGISYLSDGTFRFFQYPNRNAVGDTFKTQLFLVNTTTNNMITFNITLQFVESLVEKEEVGSKALTCVVTPNEEAQDIDLAPVAEALGTTVDDLLNDDNTYLKGFADGQYSKGWKASLGVNFNYNGEYDEYGDMYVYFEKNADGVQLISGCSDEVAEDFSANGQFCFDVNDKVYVFYVNFVSPDVAAGITNVATEKKNSNAIFDLSGRQVKTPVRGLYIQNGKKFVVK